MCILCVCIRCGIELQICVCGCAIYELIVDYINVWPFLYNNIKFNVVFTSKPTKQAKTCQ